MFVIVHTCLSVAWHRRFITSAKEASGLLRSLDSTGKHPLTVLGVHYLDCITVFILPILKVHKPLKKGPVVHLKPLIAVRVLMYLDTL